MSEYMNWASKRIPELEEKLSQAQAEIAELKEVIETLPVASEFFKLKEELRLEREVVDFYADEFHWTQVKFRGIAIHSLFMAEDEEGKRARQRQKDRNKILTDKDK